MEYFTQPANDVGRIHKCINRFLYLNGLYNQISELSSVLCHYVYNNYLGHNNIRIINETYSSRDVSMNELT